MMKNWKQRTAVCAVTASLLGGASTVAQTDYAEVRRDVEVLSRALQAASGGTGHGDSGVAHIEGSYLSGQGIVLRIHGHGLGHRSFVHFDGDSDLDVNFVALGEDIGAFVEEIVGGIEIGMEGLGETLANIAPPPPVPPSVMIAEELDDDLNALTDALTEHSRELQLQAKELRKEQASARRELAAAQREFEQRMEDYERQLESGGNDAEARALYERAESAMEEARRQYRAGRAAYTDKRKEIRKERQEERQERIAALASTTLDNFCRYGTSLRSLPADERITLVFDGMGGDGTGDQDLFYVIRKADFTECLSGDIEGTELKERADYYSF